jgi:hypothetical protein
MFPHGGIMQVMSEEDDGGESFEEKLRALARELGQSLERVTGRNVDLDEVADRIGEGGDRVRELSEFAGRWIRDVAQGPEARRSERVVPSTGDARLRLTGPDPRDVPTEEQGLALGALDSGRWKVEPGTDELIADGGGPNPSVEVGLVSELRARDWISASGEVTFLGHAALSRWQEKTTPS